MYEIDTVLKLKEQHDPDEETGEEFPYNRARVVGQSPVSDPKKAGGWTGPDAVGVIITPLSNFGGVLDEPFGKLREIYDVESIPEPVTQYTTPKVNATSLPRIPLGPSPEEQFAALPIQGEPPEDGRRRTRTDPLGDPGGPRDADGPLGKAPSKR